MDIAALIIFAVALLLAVGSPGPSIAALVSRVLARSGAVSGGDVDWRDHMDELGRCRLGSDCQDICAGFSVDQICGRCRSVVFGMAHVDSAGR